MEEAISRLVAELDDLRHHSTTSSAAANPTPLSRQSLADLNFLLSDANDTVPIDALYDELSAKSLSPSSLVPPLSAAMDSSPNPNHSLLASNAFLSLLLSPNAPVFTLFTPLSFLSLLRSLRRSLKASPAFTQPNSSKNRKRRRAGKASRKNPSQDDAGMDEEEENQENGGSSSVDVKALLVVLEKLASVMDLIHLDRFPESLRSLVQSISEIPVTAVELCENGGQYGKLLTLCSRVLRKVLKPEHGESSSSASEVLRSLSLLVFMHKSQARTFALDFVKTEMMKVAKENDGVKKAMVNFPRYLVNKAPEKAEPRALAVESITEIVRVMEFEDQVSFVKYVVSMCRGKSNLRLLAVDLVHSLVMSLKDPLGLDSEEDGGDDPWGIWCLEALVKRCSDVIAAIRGRALANLAQLVKLLSRSDRSSVVLKRFMGFGDGNDGVEMNNMLRQRCMDDKAAVRRAALHLVTNLTALLGGTIDEVVLKTMGLACSDPLISMRKAATTALSEAFRTFAAETVIIEWLHSVPRLITDNETSIQEECENMFQELVLDRICKAASATSSHSETMSARKNKEKSFNKVLEMLFPKGVLYLLREICNGEVSPWVKKICTNLGKKKRLNHKIVIALQNIIRTSESIWLSHSLPIEKWTAPPGAWFLLSEVSAFLPKAVDWEFLHHHWQLLDKHEVEGEFRSPFKQVEAFENEESIECDAVAWASDRVFLLQTISNVSVELPPEPAANLAHNLLKRVEEFNMHSTEVDAHVKALKTLCKRKASNVTEADTLVLKWVHQVLSRASKIIEKFISGNSKQNAENNFFTPPRSCSRKRRSIATSKSLTKATTAIYTIGSAVIVCPTADTSTIVPILHTIITSGSSGPKINNLPGPATFLPQEAPSFYIQGWLTMGKLCLADEKLAKNYIPLFIQELEKSESAALRNNIVVMMADFCVRYTALVDSYITKITRCLLDPCELVRRQTFLLLSRLLQRDYVKWRGVLFLRFLLSLVDESEKIRRLAEFLFGNILKVKSPLLAYNSFVEAVFVLNDCHAHHGHRESQVSRRESQSFSIRGNDEQSRSKRMHIYVCLLKQMAPEHLLATFAKLCAEILAAASDGMLNIEDATGQSVLQDAFRILCCKEIRIPSSRASSSESADIEEEGGESGAAARGKAITQAVKKGLIQNTVPIFIELKRLLESKNSPLVGSLMECLRILLKDYKNEIDDILVADKQLQKELVYDMHKYEAARAKATVAEAAASTRPNTGANQSPEGAENPAKAQGQDGKFPSGSKVASAMADAAAAATARSVLREINRGTGTPPLSSLNVPKVRSCTGVINASHNKQRMDDLQSLKKRHCFDSDDES
ncbi:hypothetical protein HN51_065630 [Arachis hypogaea]|uniref:Condensin complex subunit 1 C-terminal domain-containing protein n=1 Tax=Arachis hypogaea TaxID=3818 RepID=A0A444ZG66_ARAHY|nr:condensin-2 complex subunit D3 [Arachis hypogaea]QHO06837.1 Condensin-2 complex subunit [Arachis hypogaea]RYR13143.1 hypothetical protein Ahy_B04g070288 isoform D [Arachis hypogaea]